MGLRDTFADAVTTIFDSFDDLIFEIEYHDIEMGAYDPVTNAVAITDTTITTRGAIYNEKEVVKDWQKPTEDSFVCILSGDELGAVPTDRDWMVVDDVRWEVARVDKLPGGVAYILKLRAP